MALHALVEHRPGLVAWIGVAAKCRTLVGHLQTELQPTWVSPGPLHLYPPLAARCCNRAPANLAARLVRMVILPFTRCCAARGGLQLRMDHVLAAGAHRLDRESRMAASSFDARDRQRVVASDRSR